MQIVNKIFLINGWKNTFVFRIPGRNKAFIMLWISKGYALKISLRIWKVKFVVELG